MLPCDEPLEHDGIKYFAVENFYQAMKIDSQRRDLRVEIAAMHPHASKGCFRKFPDKFKVSDAWGLQAKVKTMRTALAWKFAPGTSWHDKLLATTDEPIIEFNNWGDTFWGWDIRKQEGSNHLGKLLMGMRDAFTRIDLDDFMA
jgi:predicted NAD-dependent protein-ADP-ribosyltransferase YbiA (DUF1768 family)